MTEREKLIELFSKAMYEETICTSDGEPVTTIQGRVVRSMFEAECLADHLLANGVNVQPLKEGDTAYVLCLGNVEEYTICKSPYEREEATYHLPVEEGEGHICVFPVAWKDIGKTVFLSREDAEKALEEKKR